AGVDDAGERLGTAVARHVWRRTAARGGVGRAVLSRHICRPAADRTHGAIRQTPSGRARCIEGFGGGRARVCWAENTTAQKRRTVRLTLCSSLRPPMEQPHLPETKR